MKRMLYMLMVIFFMISISIASSIAENTNSSSEWQKSEDGVLEVKIIGFQEKSYPKFELQLQFRVDGTESKVISYESNLAPLFSQFAAANPKYKNRKQTVTLGDITSFSQTRETMYAVKIDSIFNSDMHVELNCSADLAELFPDIFVNSDVMNCAAVVTQIKNTMLVPSSFSLTRAAIFDNSDDNLIYVFEYTAQNRTGGTSPGLAICAWNTETGKFDLSADSEVLISGNVSDSINQIVISYAILSDDTDRFFDLSVSSIMKMVP